MIKKQIHIQTNIFFDDYNRPVCSIGTRSDESCIFLKVTILGTTHVCGIDIEPLNRYEHHDETAYVYYGCIHPGSMCIFHKKNKG